jgi:cell division protease FtsH
MAEQQQQQQDKSRKQKSLGAFLLFLTVLVVILITVGKSTFEPANAFSQDQFEWRLYRGEVATIEIGANSVVEGALVGGKRYKVSIAGLDKDSELASRYRALKAVPGYEHITPAQLATALESGWYRPESARLLRAVDVQPAEEGAAGTSAAAEREITEELYLRVLATPAEAARVTDESGKKRFVVPMPKPGSSTVDLKVEGKADLAALVATLRASGASIDQIDFDISDKGGTRYEEAGGLLQNVLLLWAPWILIFVVFLLFMRQMRAQGGAGGVMSFGRSRAQLYTKENHTNVTFDDVAGAQEAKDEVREVVEFLKNPSRFTKIGGRIPRGVLLVGPPGCGKTLLAKAIAGEAEVPFFSISGSDFVEMFVGVGASRVRDLFKQARENSPCIIFLDEIDAVGRRRGSGLGGGHDEREQTLNAILVEMDGFGTDEGIIVIAATNRPDVLDPALLRPGRFDREVVIDLPDVEGREEILKVHLKKVKVGTDVDVSVLARSTPGYSGADLSAIINEAAIRAALGKREAITMEDLEEARDKVRYGRQKRSRKLELEDKKITAYHEAGHAVVASVIPELDDPHKVTIVPRGRALGSTLTLPERESYHMQKKRMLGQLALCFGGRVAEEEFCGDISAGAYDDIKRATELVRAMVSELGMSDKVGPIYYAERQGSDFLGTELLRGRMHSEETAREIDEEIKRFLNEAHERARTIVREKRAEVERIAEALLRFETLSKDEIARLMAGASVDDLRPSSGAPAAPAGERKAAAPAATAVPPKGKLGEAGLSPA